MVNRTALLACDDNAVARGSPYRRALRRLPSGLIIPGPLWHVDLKVAFGWERTFYLYDWKRDCMVPVGYCALWGNVRLGTPHRVLSDSGCESWPRPY